MDINVIQQRIGQIEQLEKEIKTSKEMIRSELENDAQYLEVHGKAKEVNLEKKRIRDQVLGRESAQKLNEDIRANNEEINTLKEILSAELVEFYTKENKEEITDGNGDIRKFKIQVKLLPRGFQDDKRDILGKYAKVD